MNAFSAATFVGQFTFAHGKSFCDPALADRFRVCHVPQMHQLLQKAWYLACRETACVLLCRRVNRKEAQDLTSGSQLQMGQVSHMLPHCQDLARALSPTALWLWSGFNSLHSTYCHLLAYSYKGRCGIKACRHMHPGVHCYRQCLVE